MSRFIFAALATVVLSHAAAAQQVPGRDLLEFPIGLTAEAPVFGGRMVGGLWNPSSNVLPGYAHAAVGVAGLTTPQEQGIQVEMLGAAVRVRSNFTASLSYTQASVSDILRTQFDPQSTASDIPYSTSLLSLGAATITHGIALGVAGRYRTSAFDTDRSSVLSFDAGATWDRVAGTPLRVGASTFLFSPSRSKQVPTYEAALDAPFIARDSTFVLRGGYSVSTTDGRGRDDYVFATTSYGQLDASAGVLQSNAYGHSDQRLRLGIGLRYADYSVGFGREEGASGFGASYQFLLTRAFR